MRFKNNIKKIMDESGLSFYKLCNISEVSDNTIRELINNPFRNCLLDTLSVLSNELGCSINDLIDDDIGNIYYEKISSENKDDPLFINNKIFSPANVEILKNLLIEVGAFCNFTIYNNYKNANIYNVAPLTSIIVNFNLLATKENDSTLFIRDFDVAVNNNLHYETAIKDTFIKAFEHYARTLKFHQIKFNIINDFKKKTIYYQGAFKLKSDLSFTTGTDPDIFINNNYVQQLELEKCAQLLELEQFNDILSWIKIFK